MPFIGILSLFIMRPLFVILGLDPRIHCRPTQVWLVGHSSRGVLHCSSCPDLIRASIPFSRIAEWILGSSPRMTISRVQRTDRKIPAQGDRLGFQSANGGVSSPLPPSGGDVGASRQRGVPLREFRVCRITPSVTFGDISPARGGGERKVARPSATSPSPRSPFPPARASPHAPSRPHKAPTRTRRRTARSGSRRPP